MFLCGSLTRDRSQNVTPRGLSSQGDESSEFMSADVDDGVSVEKLDEEIKGSEDQMPGEDESDSEDRDEEAGVALDAAPQDTALPAPPPASDEGDDIAAMIARSDADVARALAWGRSQESWPQQREESSEDSQEPSESEGDEDPGEQEETQVVQDSVGAPGPRDHAMDAALDRDSGNASMDDSDIAMNEDSGADQDSDDGMQDGEESSAATNDQPLLSGNQQDRASAAEETVRQIQAERSAGAGAGTAQVNSAHVQKPAAAVTDERALQQYRRERSAAKKLRRRAEAKQQRRAAREDSVFRDMLEQVGDAAERAAAQAGLGRHARKRAKRAALRGVKVPDGGASPFDQQGGGVSVGA